MEVVLASVLNKHFPPDNRKPRIGPRCRYLEPGMDQAGDFEGGEEIGEAVEVVDPGGLVEAETVLAEQGGLEREALGVGAGQGAEVAEFLGSHAPRPQPRRPRPARGRGAGPPGVRGSGVRGGTPAVRSGRCRGSGAGWGSRASGSALISDLRRDLRIFTINPVLNLQKMLIKNILWVESDLR